MSQNDPLTRRTRRLAVLFALGASVFLPQFAAISDPLQGRVEDIEAGKALNDNLEARMDQFDGKNAPLKGKAKSNGALQGGLQDGGYSQLQGGAQNGGYNPLQAGVQDAGQNPLQGSAAGGPTNLSGGINDPDGADGELQIGWDRWRNTLTQAIQAGTINKINVHNDINFVLDPRKHMMVSRYPQGISTQYSIDVLPNGRIINIRLMLSSGYPTYDQSVMQAIWDLQGNGILRYPNGSKRTIVNQQSSVYTAAESRFNNFKFGDVERQRQ